MAGNFHSTTVVLPRVSAINYAHTKEDKQNQFEFQPLFNCRKSSKIRLYNTLTKSLFVV